jgi:hypothetical protein
MRTPNGTTLSAAGVALAVMAACAAPAAGPRPAAAAAGSAEQFGVSANVRAQAPGQGYGARDRHMADCLATYPGYNPDTDQVAVRPGVTERCPL